MLSYLQSKISLIWFSISILLWIIFSQSLFWGTLVGNTKLQINMYNQASNFIRKNTSTSDTIYVNLYAPWIYAQSNRKAASSIFLGGYVQVENKNHFGYNFEQIVINDLKKQPPKYIIQLSQDVEDLSTPILNSYIRENTITEYKIEKLEIRKTK